jgi:hypothetical protein
VNSMNEAEYQDKLLRLKQKHGTGYVSNPGGGEFFTDDWRCQVYAQSYQDDYEKLAKFLIERGLESRDNFTFAKDKSSYL